MNVAPSMALKSGNYFNLLNPEESTYTLEDIAHALANTCRFGGQCNGFYSVAQHSVHVAEIAPLELKRAALFHDAAEAFIGDIPNPLKQLLPEYQELEEKIERAIFKKLGIEYPLNEKIKQLDLVLLKTEKRDLMPQINDEWPMLNGIPTLERGITGKSPQAAERMKKRLKNCMVLVLTSRFAR